MLPEENHRPNTQERAQDTWEKVRLGNEKAFEHIYRSHVGLLHHYGVSMCQDAALTDDCIQELFIHLWQNRESVYFTSSIRSYLIVALRNRILNTLRKEATQKHRHEASQASSDTCSKPLEETLAEEDGHKRTKSQLATKLKELPPRQRQVILLVFYEKMSLEEASISLEIDIRSLYTLMSRAVSSLRKSFKGSK